ncbi:MAG: LacI family DNA-binding transcriptional regulator [Candidatus Aminicenantes bacterium]|nr:LacI family DNA-binding transcriptional regulator [Candidatus Aminicenantes bacterium]
MSIKKIREQTGFSNSTISRVLNGKAKEFRISDKTTRAIVAAAKKLKYRPNILARSLRLQKTMTIGLIVPDIRNAFFGELSWRIEELLRGHGYSTILCNTNEVPENEEFYLKVLIDRQVDGIIIAPIHTREWKDLHDIRRGTEIILIDRIFYDTDIPWVTGDNLKAAEALTSILIKKGFKRIAYLGGTSGTYINSMRFQGYQNALKAHTLPLIDDIIQFGGYSVEAGEAMMQNLLKADPDIKAVMCVNNLVFQGAMKVVQGYELTTSNPIIMGAFDIHPFCGIFKRPLACASQNLEKMAQAAVSLIVNRIQGKRMRKTHLILPIRVESHRFR